MSLFDNRHHILSMASGRIQHRVVPASTEWVKGFQIQMHWDTYLSYTPATVHMSWRQCCFFVGNCHVSLYSTAVQIFDRRGPHPVLYVLFWHETVFGRWMHPLGTEYPTVTDQWSWSDHSWNLLVEKQCLIVQYVQHRQEAQEQSEIRVFGLLINGSTYSLRGLERPNLLLG